jgi:hypothetical protein
MLNPRAQMAFDVREEMRVTQLELMYERERTAVRLSPAPKSYSTASAVNTRRESSGNLNSSSSDGFHARPEGMSEEEMIQFAMIMSLEDEQRRSSTSSLLHPSPSLESITSATGIESSLSSGISHSYANEGGTSAVNGNSLDSMKDGGWLGLDKDELASKRILKSDAAESRSQRFSSSTGSSSSNAVDIMSKSLPSHTATTSSTAASLPLHIPQNSMSARPPTAPDSVGNSLTSPSLPSPRSWASIAGNATGSGQSPSSRQSSTPLSSSFQQKRSAITTSPTFRAPPNSKNYQNMLAWYEQDWDDDQDDTMLDPSLQRYIVSSPASNHSTTPTSRRASLTIPIGGISPLPPSMQTLGNNARSSTVTGSDWPSDDEDEHNSRSSSSTSRRVRSSASSNNVGTPLGYSSGPSPPLRPNTRQRFVFGGTTGGSTPPNLLRSPRLSGLTSLSPKMSGTSGVGVVVAPRASRQELEEEELMYALELSLLEN